MKNLSKPRKALVVLMSLTAPVFWAAVAMFIPKINYALGLLHADDADPDDMDKILSYNIHNVSLLIPVVIAMIVILLGAIIGAFFITRGKTKFEKRFGYMSVVAGGLGLNTLYALVSFFVGKEVTLKQKRVVFGRSTIAAIAVIPVGFVVAMAAQTSYRGIDTPTNVKGVKLSLDPKYKNIIEIFTDGFDPQLMYPKLKDDTHFPGFTMYTKFMTSGAETSYSYPTITGGLDDFNIFKQYDGGSSNSMAGLTSTMFAKSTAVHLQTGIKDANMYMLNTNGIGKAPSYQTSVSGDGHAFDEINKAKHINIQAVNWGQAKKDVAGPFGLAKYSQDAIFYKWLKDNMHVDKSPTAKGAHVLMEEFITHAPRISDRNSSPTFVGVDGIDKSTDSLKWNLDTLVEKLKSIKGNGTNAYDNSLVVFWGDHSNHQNPVAHPTRGIPGEKWHSFMMIKYPKSDLKTNDPRLTNSKPILDDQRVVYAPYMNHIIDSGNKDNADFIHDNKNFRPGREYIGFFGHEAAMMTFAQGHLKNGLPVLDIAKDKSDPSKEDWRVYDDYKKHGDKTTRQDWLLNESRWEVK